MVRRANAKSWCDDDVLGGGGAKKLTPPPPAYGLHWQHIASTHLNNTIHPPIAASVSGGGGDVESILNYMHSWVTECLRVWH